MLNNDDNNLENIENLTDKHNKFIAYILAHKINCVIGIAIIIVALIVLVVSNAKGDVTATDEEITVEESTTDFETESTIYSVLESDITEATTATPLEKCHYNSDGKLYGTKGKFSGLWPQLEPAARASNDKNIKDLMEYVGDNTELKKSNYEQDKFVKINGYGTVHWSQSGHKWPNNYSIAASGFITNESLFSSLKKDEKVESITPSINIGSNEPAILDEIVLSDSALEPQSKEHTTETTTKLTETNNKSQSVSKVSGLAPGKVWGSNACGVCSLAMALSTLSGVTVSPPEVALAANLLIGKSAWYDTILFSKSQAKLAQLAGFPVYMEPYNQAKKSTMDACLDANGVALFVSNKPAWVSGNGRHYIMVRNRVGDKYYTADSGKNPTGGFSYDELSSGYCQQYIVYIYPKK